MKYVLLLVSLIVVLTACGQTGTEPALAPTVPSPALPAAELAPVTVKVRWPQEAGLSAQAISDNAQSLVIRVAAAATPATVIDTLTLNKSTALITEGIIEAPIGSDVFTATAYSLTNGGGSALGTVSITQTITEGTKNTVSLALVGIAATVTVTIADDQLLSTAETTTATAVVKDASGFVLVGRAVTWLSNAATVATVNASGVIDAVGAGNATITARDNVNTSVSGSDTLTVTETDIEVTGR